MVGYRALLLLSGSALGSLGLDVTARDSTAAALQSRRGAGDEPTGPIVAGSEYPASSSSLLDSAAKRKKEPDFLVKPADQTRSPTLPTYESYAGYPPATPVDQTVAEPPDADGDPYNQPVWGENTPPPAAA
mmetsp:Transcript_30595/g.87396  ORF Transcript_30595/g.87396 Transcript_30595/m.87396 type:complete len:131 (+) Transcript_30595:3-395(+)